MVMLKLFAAEANRAGFRIVQNSDDAWFELRAGGHLNDADHKVIEVTLVGNIKLNHDMFLAMLNDETFPYLGYIGASVSLEILPTTTAAESKDWARDSMIDMWNRNSEQILALCEARKKLLAEGWKEIDELRKQLIVEMKRVRAVRARETQLKRLELDAEKGIGR